MPGIATLRIELEVTSEDGETSQSFSRTVRFSPVQDGGSREVVTLPTNTFTPLTVPPGARAVCLIPTDLVARLYLKGVSADEGTSISPLENPINGPMILFLGVAPSIGILNQCLDNATVTVIWL